MALIHRAELAPSKLDLLKGWLPGRAWYPGEQDVRQLGAYRFDDPAGEVGIEGVLLQAGDGPVLHVPMTYRAAPLDQADGHLVGTTEHSVLGTRWVYDACGDAVWARALATAVLAGGPQAEELVDGDGELQQRRPTVRVTGSGTACGPLPDIESVSSRDAEGTTVVLAGTLELIIVRVVGAVGASASGAQTLTASWDGGGPATLAAVHPPA